MRPSPGFVLLTLLVACGGEKPADTTPTSDTETPTSGCTADADNDGVCDDSDLCDGDDATGDTDGDLVCDDTDPCTGPDNVDTDGDGVCDSVDPCPSDANDDSDGDGSCDSDDLCDGDDATGDGDNDGVCDDSDPCTGPDNVDSDGDGVCDSVDPCPSDANDDSDGDGSCDSDDICPGSDDTADSDSDGVPDGCDSCPDDANDDSDGDGSCDSDDLCLGDDATGDADNDGVCDDSDLCNGDDATGDTDGDLVCDDTDLCDGDDATGDTDGDLVCDDTDLCDGDDATGDTDGDGLCDSVDPCPSDANDDSDGDGSCDSDDLCLGDDATGDADNDGVCDDSDLCDGDDATGDSDGDLVCDDTDLCTGPDNVDTDGDGVCDSVDPCPSDANNDSDGDGSCDGVDICPGFDDGTDTDSDGTPDGCDPCPIDANDDSDGDGSCDSDDLCLGDDATGDTDSDDICDDSDLCSGDDASGDADGDGLCLDSDNCDDRYNPNQEDVCDVWFVDDDSLGGDGTSWATASPTVQEAAGYASAGEQIWVAAGRYLPAVPGDDELVALNGTELYGGFAGNEMRLADREGLFDETVLSGDFYGDDNAGANLSDNANHIIDAHGTVVIDGFVIADGYGPGGAGVRAWEDVTLRNSVIRDNTDASGGAGINYQGAIRGVVENCAFFNNHADRGGVVWIEVSDSVAIRNVAFQGSTSDSPNAGRAIHVQDSWATIDNVSIYGTDDPAIRAVGPSVVSFRNSTVWGHDEVLQDDFGWVSIDNVCAGEDLVPYGNGNVWLDGNSAEYGDPFLYVGYRLLLAQVAGGQPFTSACVDAGDNTTADAEFPDWSTTSTCTDVWINDGGDVDPAAHFWPDETLCVGEDAAGDLDFDGVCDDY